MAVLVVDAANVIGSRPTGWWRDRPGAARRFAEQVREGVSEGRLERPVVLVLEGQARKGVDEGNSDGVQVVHARGQGDDAIVSVARANRGAIVVTADRELIGRVQVLDAEVRGPGWFLKQLELAT